MNLSRNDVIAGYPAAKVRDLLRHLRDGGGVAYAAHILKTDEDSAGALLSQLTREGYVEMSWLRENTFWANTIKGNALAQANFMKPISRERADRILTDFLRRVAAVNGDPYYFIGVNKVEGFGSYLSDAKFVNDIDLIVHYEWKGNLSYDERGRLSQLRSHEAQKRGRKFRNIAEEVTWPTQEVTLYIRAKEPRLSLHSVSDGITEVVQKKVVYERPSELSSSYQLSHR